MGEQDGAVSRDQNVLLNYAVYRLLGGEDKAADRPTEEYSGALEYAALVYGKAPYFYVDMEKRLGKRQLDRALRAFSDLAWEIAYGPLGWPHWKRMEQRRCLPWPEVVLSSQWRPGLGLGCRRNRAMELVLGEEVGRMTTEMLSSLGMTPAELLLFSAHSGGEHCCQYEAPRPLGRGGVSQSLSIRFRGTTDPSLGGETQNKGAYRCCFRPHQWPLHRRTLG